jgi:prevent-host-death family protein
MHLGVAEARRRFKEILDRVAHGEVVNITRRDTVIAVLGPPSSLVQDKPWGDVLLAWRRDWDVDSWPDDQPFADVRDHSEGREPPW